MPIETLLLSLQLLASLEEFLSNKQVQAMLDDAELIDNTLEQLGKNADESARIKAKLAVLITS